MMKTLPAEPVVAVIGATGVVGRTMLKVLEERHFPNSEVRAIASERSVGRKIPFAGEELSVVAIDNEALKGVDLVLLDTPDEVALEWAPKAVESGATVIDKSAAWRMSEHVPLVVPEINPGAVGSHQGIIASPNCTTIGVIVPLFPLVQAFGIEKVVVASYQAVSGAGQRAVAELAEQVAKVADDLEALSAGEWRGPDPSEFGAPIAFNAIPKVGSFVDGEETSEERKLREESRKILDISQLDLTATCVRIPSIVGHGAAVHSRFNREVSVEEVTQILSSAPGVTVTDLPTPLEAAGKDDCLVGRIRSDKPDPRAIWFFSACDNLRKGAALNALQIAELLLP